jgi:SSS family solute:Na+ symporter
MPSWMTGFFSAVLLGAILSSFNSVLNSTCTIFSLEIYQGLINKNADEKKVIDVSKKFGWIITFSSMIIAPFLLSQKSIFSYLQTMNAIYFVPVFSVVIVGILTKRVSSFAANIGLIFAFITICTVYFIPSLNITDKNSPVFIMHNFHFISLVLFLSIALMLIIGKIKPMEKDYVQKYSGDVNMENWKYTKHVSFVLFSAVLFIYIIFADISIIGNVSLLEKIIAFIFVSGTLFSILKLSYNKNLN